MDIIDIDVSKLSELAENLITIAKDLNNYVDNFEENVTSYQKNNIWKGYAATNFRVLSKKDIIQYREYSKSIDNLGQKLKSEALELEEEISSLKEV